MQKWCNFSLLWFNLCLDKESWVVNSSGQKRSRINHPVKPTISQQSTVHCSYGEVKSRVKRVINFVQFLWNIKIVVVYSSVKIVIRTNMHLHISVFLYHPRLYLVCICDIEQEIRIYLVTAQTFKSHDPGSNNRSTEHRTTAEG